MHRVVIWLAMMVLISLISTTSPAQCGSISRDSPGAVRQEVNRIFNSTLDAMESTTPEGGKVSTWMPPDQAARRQIRCLGTSAIPAIADLLKSDRSFGVLLAVRMLGWVGGSEIVTPLKELLESSSSQIAKTNALEALSAAPVEQALPIVQQVLQSDGNRYVREKAAKIEARLKANIEN